MDYITVKGVSNRNSVIQIEECNGQHRITAISLNAGHAKSIVLDYYSSIEDAMKAFNLFLEVYNTNRDGGKC